MLTHEYSQHLHARRLAANTIRIRLIYVRQFSATHPNLIAATPADLERFILSHPDWSAETMNCAVSSLRSFYRWATDNGLTATDPARRLETVHVTRTTPRIATDAALTEALTHATTVERAMLLLGAEAGLRRTEIATAHTTDRDGRWLTVTGKGGRTRTVHLAATLLDTLESLESVQGAGYYFPGRCNGHVSPSHLAVRIRRLTGFNPHALRHRAGTATYRASGNDIRVAQEFLGHSSPTITAIYVHVGREQMASASTLSALAA